MKNVFTASVIGACALAGVLAALALADAGPAIVGATTTAPTTTSTGATTTMPTSTVPTTTLPTTTVPTTTATVPIPRTIADGVVVGGVPVGGLTTTEAGSRIKKRFVAPIKLRLGGHLYSVNPKPLASPKITKAVERARRAQPFASLSLHVVVRTARVRAYVALLAKKVEQAPVDSRLILRNLKPHLTTPRPGVALAQLAAVKALTRSLRLNLRNRITLHTTRTSASVTPSNFGPVIVIHRGSNRLYLYRGDRLNRIFAVATGQAVYPTPLGSFQIVVMWRNPWWYPPNSPWAAGEKPIPPGPNNPLGTRWMGISAPGVGIHGTNNDASIGYSVSHGCIRMHVGDAEWLFNHVDIGTPVFIVSA